MMTVQEFIDEWRSPSEYVVAHTSGSTGVPKEIRLLKSDMQASARATNEFFGLGCASRIAAALSCDFIAGKMMAVRALESGAELVEIEPSRHLDLSGISGHLDLLAIVPQQAEYLLAQPGVGDKVGCLLIGGAPLSEGQRKAIVAASSVEAWESYGMTETCSHVALRRVTADDSAPFEAMPGIAFFSDSRGCLGIRAPRFSFGELITNDCVKLLDSGHFRWLGRADNVINSAGIKLHPEQLERKYAPFLEGREFCVCSRSDPLWGQCAVLRVEGSPIPGLAEKMASGISDHRRLPKAIEYLESLPRTANGKLIRTC